MNTDAYNTSTPPLTGAPSSHGVLSPEERARAADYLTSTGEKLLELTSGLSDQQWQFRPAADRWSIGEIAEHVVVVEKRIQANVTNMINAEAADPGRDHAQGDELIISRIFTRVTRVEAPLVLHPSGHWPRAETLERFLETRSETMALLASAPALRGRVIAHPIMGPWDGYQWILAAAGHSARHLDQILEVKNAPDFPQSQPCVT